MEKTEVLVNGLDVHLLGVCRGLEGEAEAATEAIRGLDPTVVALAMDPIVADELDELEAARELGAEDEAYMEGLSQWGSVKLPSPTFPAAIEAADEIGARVEGVDMARADYLDLHLDEVGVFEMIKRALRARWLLVRPPSADSPAGYCRAFDARMNAGPFERLEQARERSMAANLAQLDGERVAFVVEIERLDGVTRDLREGDRAPRAASDR